MKWDLKCNSTVKENIPELAHIAQFDIDFTSHFKHISTVKQILLNNNNPKRIPFSLPSLFLILSLSLSFLQNKKLYLYLHCFFVEFIFFSPSVLSVLLCVYKKQSPCNHSTKLEVLRLPWNQPRLFFLFSLYLWSLLYILCLFFFPLLACLVFFSHSLSPSLLSLWRNFKIFRVYRDTKIEKEGRHKKRDKEREREREDK